MRYGMPDFAPVFCRCLRAPVGLHFLANLGSNLACLDNRIMNAGERAERQFGILLICAVVVVALGLGFFFKIALLEPEEIIPSPTPKASPTLIHPRQHEHLYYL